MPEARDRHREVLEISLFRFRLDNDEPIRILESEAAEEEVVDQTEDGGVHPNPERERDNSEQSEAGRLEELANGETKIVHELVAQASSSRD